MNLSKVKGLMAENNEKQKDLSILLGISIYSVRKKINGKTQFTVNELEKIINHFNCSADIFFNKVVTKNDTK